MAQGCHLIFSGTDRSNFDFRNQPERPDHEIRPAVLKALELDDHSRIDQGLIARGPEDSLTIDTDRATEVYGISKEQIRVFADRLQELPAEDRQIVVRLLESKCDRQADLLTGLGNEWLNDRMSQAVPQALARIYLHDNRSVGLFEPARSGASPWIGTLKNTGQGKADGCAYEVLAAAKMLDRPITSQRTGAALEIGPLDQLDFGVKQQASYGRDRTFRVTDGETWSDFHQPQRSTVEADLLITRSGCEDQIAIDFKHTDSERECRITQDQLEGVWTALRTGDVDEYHFVSNFRFDAQTVNAVMDINRRIEEHNSNEDNLSIPPIQLFEHLDWRSA